MSNADHPPTLVDLAARASNELWSRDLGMDCVDALPRLLAALRALPRFDVWEGLEACVMYDEDPDGDWIKVSDLRAVLGEEGGMSQDESIEELKAGLRTLLDKWNADKRLAELEERLRALAGRWKPLDEPTPKEAVEIFNAMTERQREAACMIYRACAASELRALLGEAAR